MTPLARLFWGALVIKFLFVAALPLTSDEAYYWVWSQHPQLSYFDHPPFVAWLFGVGEYLRFIPGGIRWPGLVLAHAGLGIWLTLLRPYLSEEQRWWWLVLAVTCPLLGGSALVITPDVPLLFFYALTLWIFERWRTRATFWRSLALGLSLGLGLTSKYMMVLLPLSLAWPILRDRTMRRTLLRNVVPLGLGSILGTCPVWMWNWLNDFASIRFQAHHGLGHKVWKPSWTTEYLGLQLALVSPPLAYLAWRARHRWPNHFAWVAFTPFVFFLCTTSRGYVEANWPIAAYPVVLGLAVSELPRFRRAITGTAVAWTLVLIALATVILTSPPWSRGTKLREFHQFDAVADSVRDVKPLFARSYQMASKLSFELGRPVYKLRGMLRHDFFDELSGSVPTERPYYVVVERGDPLPAAFLAVGDVVLEVRPLDGDFELRKVGVR